MKKIILILALTLVACNFQASDSTEDLPAKYQFIEEGGSQNRILRDNELIIDSGAVDFSFDDRFIFFSVDTTYSMEPKKIEKEKLLYYVHNIKKDSFSKQVNYNFIKKFILKNKIEDENNILLKK
jgi:hypothetical protein